MNFKEYTKKPYKANKMGNAQLVLLAFIVFQTINTVCHIMSQEELRSYRLNSMEEPTDEMLKLVNANSG